MHAGRRGAGAGVLSVAIFFGYFQTTIPGGLPGLFVPRSRNLAPLHVYSFIAFHLVVPSVQLTRRQICPLLLARFSPKEDGQRTPRVENS